MHPPTRVALDQFAEVVGEARGDEEDDVEDPVVDWLDFFVCLLLCCVGLVGYLYGWGCNLCTCVFLVLYMESSDSLVQTELLLLSNCFSLYVVGLGWRCGVYIYTETHTRAYVYIHMYIRTNGGVPRQKAIQPARVPAQRLHDLQVVQLVPLCHSVGWLVGGVCI